MSNGCCMLAVLSEFERDQVIDRTRLPRADKRAHSGQAGGPPFGYRTKNA